MNKINSTTGAHYFKMFKLFHKHKHLTTEIDLYLHLFNRKNMHKLHVNHYFCTNLLITKFNISNLWIKTVLLRLALKIFG